MKMAVVCLVLAVAMGMDSRASLVVPIAAPPGTIAVQPVDVRDSGMAIPDEEMEPGAALSEAARNAGILDVPESSLFAGTDSNPQHLRVPSSANAFTPSVETGFDLVTTFIYTLGACSLAWVGLLLRPRTKSAQKFRHR